METPVRLFRMDVSKFPVTFEDRADGRYVVGLPIMKPGRWNGEEYTADDLAGVARSFAQVRDLDSFTPAIKPIHTYDHKGQPIAFDPRETLARWVDLRTDETGALLGDAKVLDASMEDGVVSGKLQYLSAELWPNLRIAATDETVPLAFVGAAFVDHPGVKGMPWEVIVNSADFPAQRKGADKMNAWETVKALFRKVGASEEDVAALDALEQETGGGVVTNDGKPPETDGERRQVEMLQAQLSEQNKTILQLVENARLDRAQAFAEGLCAEGYVPPAKKPALFALADRLLVDEQPIRVLSAGADGAQTAQDTVPIELLAALIRGNGQKVSSKPRGLAFEGSEDPDAREPIPDADLDALAASVRGGGE
jgi:hypothetical protein